jgi:hypothetical protein
MSFIRFRFVVIGLDPDYQWCVAGNPRRKSFWVLSRKPELSKEVWDLATQIASRCARAHKFSCSSCCSLCGNGSNGFDTSKLARTPQLPSTQDQTDECPSPLVAPRHGGLARLAARLVAVYVPAGLVAATAAAAARLGGWRSGTDGQLRHMATEAGRGALRLVGQVAMAGIRAGSVRASRSLATVVDSGTGPDVGGGGGGRAWSGFGASWIQRGVVYLSGAAAVIKPLMLRDLRAGGASAVVTSHRAL